MNNREAADLRRYRAHDDVIVMYLILQRSTTYDTVQPHASWITVPVGVQPGYWPNVTGHNYHWLATIAVMTDCVRQQ